MYGHVLMHKENHVHGVIKTRNSQHSSGATLQDTTVNSQGNFVYLNYKKRLHIAADQKNKEWLAIVRSYKQQNNKLLYMSTCKIILIRAQLSVSSLRARYMKLRGAQHTGTK